MKVLLRLRGLDRAQHQSILTATDEMGLLHPVVGYKGSSRDKDGHNVDLKIETERDVRDDGYTQKVTVTRDVIDKLWDLLGVFPRTEILPADSIYELTSATTHLAEARVEKIINHIGHGQDDAVAGELSMIKKEQKELRKQITFLTGHE